MLPGDLSNNVDIRIDNVEFKWYHFIRKKYVNVEMETRGHPRGGSNLTRLKHLSLHLGERLYYETQILV